MIAVTAPAPADSAAREELFALRQGVSCAVLPGGSLQVAAWPHADVLGRLSGRPAALAAPAAGEDPGFPAGDAARRLLHDLTRPELGGDGCARRR